MPQVIERRTGTPVAATFAVSLANSTAIPMSNAAGLALITPTGATSTTITWYASHTVSGPYRPVYLSNGTAASTAVVAERCYIAPPELFSCTWLKGAAGAEVVCVVMTKT